MKNTRAVIIPSRKVHQKVAGKIDLKNTLNAKPCDCTACNSCRCAPCK